MSARVEWTTDQERLELLRRRAASGIGQNASDVEWLLDRYDRAVKAAGSGAVAMLAVLHALGTCRQSTADHVLDEAAKWIEELAAFEAPRSR